MGSEVTRGDLGRENCVWLQGGSVEETEKEEREK